MVLKQFSGTLDRTFSIFKGRKAVLRKCVTRCRYQGKPLSPSETPDVTNYRYGVRTIGG